MQRVLMRETSTLWESRFDQTEIRILISGTLITEACRILQPNDMPLFVPQEKKTVDQKREREKKRENLNWLLDIKV